LWLSGQYERSHGANEESLALFRSLGDDEGIAVLLQRIGISTLGYLGDTKRARELLNESLHHYRQAGSTRGENEVIGGLGYVTREEGDIAGSVELFARAAELAAETGFTWWEVGMLAALVESLIDLGRLDEAEAKGRDHLRLARQIGDRQSSLLGLVLSALLAAKREDPFRAGRMWGAVEAEERRSPVGQWESERPNYADRILALDGPEFARGREEGGRLSLSAAIDAALGGRTAAGA
jgi:tetratricopeptide (TPR) repeat protein